MPEKKTYLLRDIPPDVVRKAKARAALDEQSIRAILMGCLAAYADGAPIYEFPRSSLSGQQPRDG